MATTIIENIKQTPWCTACITGELFCFNGDLRPPEYTIFNFVLLLSINEALREPQLWHPGVYFDLEYLQKKFKQHWQWENFRISHNLFQQSLFSVSYQTYCCILWSKVPGPRSTPGYPEIVPLPSIVTRKLRNLRIMIPRKSFDRRKSLRIKPICADIYMNTKYFGKYLGCDSRLCRYYQFMKKLGFVNLESL